MGNIFADDAVADRIPVSELDASLFTNENSPWDGYTYCIDKECNGGPLYLNNVLYEKGLWMHGNNEGNTPTRLHINIAGKGFTGFYATIGVHSNMPGSVRFRVYGDGAQLFESGLFRPITAALDIGIPLTGVDQLTLEIDNGGDGYGSDWAVWGNASFSTGAFVPVENETEDETPRVDPYVPGQELYASDLLEENFHVPNESWAGYTIYFNQNQNGQPLTIAGETFEKGIWTHANPIYDLSIVEIDISKYDFTSFRVKVGIDDAQGVGGNGSCEFLIYGDGELLTASPLMRGNTPAEELVANIAGVQTLTLCTTNGGDDHSFDWGDWVNPVLGYEFEAETKPAETESAETEPTETFPEVTVEVQTEPVTEPVTEPATESETNPVTDPVTEPATDPATESPTDNGDVFDDGHSDKGCFSALASGAAAALLLSLSGMACVLRRKD